MKSHIQVVLFLNIGPNPSWSVVVFTPAQYRNMRFSYCSWTSSFAAFSLIAATRAYFCGLKPGPIQDSQSMAGHPFIGHAVRANELRSKYQFIPNGTSTHQDGGNTNNVDFPAPLGYDLDISSISLPLVPLLWDSQGRLTAGYEGPCNNSNATTQALVAVHPGTLEIEASWLSPVPQSSLNFAYMELLERTNEIVVSSQNGYLFVVKRFQNGTKPVFIQTRQIDIASTGILNGIPLLNAFFDANGNIWFTTGGILGVDNITPQSATIVGYVEPNGTVHSLTIPNQMVENGIAVSRNTMFMVTGPTGADNHSDGVGFMAAFQPGPRNSVSVVWNATYQAGNGVKPGGFARGSGCTPVLLGDDFVAITDNNNTQIHLLVYHQAGTSNQLPVCKIPLFHPNASGNDNNPIVQFDGTNYGLVVQNTYNEPTLDQDPSNINGNFNNATGEAPGLSKFTIAGDGSGCSLEWSIPIRMTINPLLSTKTGLIYGYTQSEKLANGGHYVWYSTAIDFDSGKIVWKARAGAGGVFDPNYKNPTIGPDGTLFHLVAEGLILVRDGRDA